MTPAEMADWLETEAVKHIYCPHSASYEHEVAGKLHAAAAMLRAQPTDAQKIEALDAASQAGVVGAEVAAGIEAYDIEPWRKNYSRYEPSAAAAHDAASLARLAMRLLGLNPEDEG